MNSPIVEGETVADDLTLTLETLWALLEGRSVGVLATLRRGGRPQLSNIAYAYDPSTRIVRLNAPDFRAKTRNLRRDSRASLHVTSEDFATWVVAEGEATVSPPAGGPGDEIYEQILDLFREVGAPVTSDHLRAYPIRGRVFIRLQVERIYGGDDKKSLGISSDAPP